MPTVLITGANRGLGLEFARQYLNENWDVVAVCRRASDELNALAGERLRIMRCDLTSDSDLDALADDLSDVAIDVLINNAGTMGNSTFAEAGAALQPFGAFDRSEWHRVFDINVCTPMRIAELFAPRMNAGGRIATISSMLGSMALNTIGGLYAYRASKAAVNSITKSMGVDLARRNLIAVALHPGWVRTEMGGDAADIDAETSVNGMRRVLEDLTIDAAGRFLAYNGDEMPY